MLFDLHLHPSTKAFLTGTEHDKRISCRETVEVRLWRSLDESPVVGGDRVDSQSSLKQLIDGKVVLGVFPLHALERDFANAAFFKQIKLVIKPRRSSAVPEWQLFYNIVNKVPGFLPFQLIAEELKLLQRDLAADFEMPASLQNATPAPGKIIALLSVEGGHCFMEEEDTDTFNHGDANAIQRIVNRFESFVANAGTRMAYLTLTHIGRSPMCTQAFSFAQAKEKRITEPFMPRDVPGTGAIRPVGWALVKKSLEKGVLIDVKHMSYRSRCEYYRFVKEQQAAGKNIPVVASHMGVTGLPFSKVKQLWTTDPDYQWNEGETFNGALRLCTPRERGFGGRKFYPISLNLYDEEIRFIVETGGLIGVSLDQRILGQKYPDSSYTDDSYDCEYMSRQDFSWLTGAEYDAFASSVFGAAPPRTRPQSKAVSDVDAHYFCNNILHMVYAGGPNTWKQLCIGSDYDGLIDALEVCQTAKRIENLKGNMKLFFKNIIFKTDTPGETFYLDMANLDADLDAKIDDLFYGNGWRFLREHFAGAATDLIA